MILSPFVGDERQEASPQYVVNNLEINPFTLNLNPNEHHAQRVVLDLTLTSSSWPAFLVLRATRQPSSRVRSFWSPAPQVQDRAPTASTPTHARRRSAPRNRRARVPHRYVNEAGFQGGIVEAHSR